MIPTLYLRIGVALIVLSGLFLGYQKIWNRGYAARVAEESASIQAQISSAVEKARVQWRKSAGTAAAQVKTEQQIVERIRYVDREIPKVVELAGSCRDLGPAFLRVFNGAVEAADGGPGSPPDPPGEPTRRVPALPARSDE